MRPFDYFEPRSLEEAVDHLREHGEEAHPIAGGTALVLMLKQQLLRPAILVGLRGLAALGGIKRRADGGIDIGANTTHRDVERSPEVRRYCPALADVFGHIATVRIRNQGTIGGNLAHADPAQDPPPILLAMDASVVVVGVQGERTIPLASFFVDFFETVLEPGEIITTVQLPGREPGAHAAYVKFLPRTQDDYATVAVAASARLDETHRWRDVRIALGAVGPVPLRVKAAEGILEGTRFEAAAVAEAADVVAGLVDPLDDLRGSSEYKREMARVWTRRALERLATASNQEVE